MTHPSFNLNVRVALLVAVLATAVAVPLAVPDRPNVVDLLLVAAAVFAALAVRDAAPVAASKTASRSLLLVGLVVLVAVLVFALR
jgi:hypothetical protein